MTSVPDDDDGWPICDQCGAPEPCRCLFLCELCLLLLMTPSEPCPCRGKGQKQLCRPLVPTPPPGDRVGS